MRNNIPAIIFVVSLLFSARAAAQTYREMPDPGKGDHAVWQALPSDAGACFGSANVRYARSSAPDLSTTAAEWHTVAWKGEKVHTQLVVWSRVPLDRVSVRCGEPENGRGVKIPAGSVSAKLVGYVMSDGLNKADGSGMRLPPMHERDSCLMADVIDMVSQCAMQPNTVRPFWLSVEVPRETPAGIYQGTVEVTTDGRTFPLPFSVTVVDRTLPEPSEWAFKLDLWQNPFSVSRYHKVETWSEDHFRLMRPYFEMLAAAGQNNITVSMIHDPWRSQTYDPYGSMIRWIKRADGGWEYDYTVFDRWVEFMDSTGIDGIISCYTMVPWNEKFYYYDQLLGRDTLLVAKTGSPEYEAHWKPMLHDFARHLREKGWFGRTNIAMDERPLQAMQDVIKLVRGIDPDFKISLAGNYHDSIAMEIYDYCIASGQRFPAETLAARKNAGLPSTFYTCCVEGRPNTFTISPPAEAAWLPMHAACEGYDGYLRWAYNCWPVAPLRDSRFRRWTSGDTFLVYPGPRSSIRFERLVEGIQQFEKARILMAEFEESGLVRDAARLREAIGAFRLESLDTMPAHVTVDALRTLMDEYAQRKR